MRRLGIIGVGASSVAAGILGYTPETTFALNDFNDPRTRVIPEFYELIRSEQISASATVGTADKIRYELLTDLLGESLPRQFEQTIRERVRVAEVSKWHTLVQRPERRLDRFLNYAATFLSTSRAEGLFQLSESGHASKIKISPMGIEDRTRDLSLAKSAINDAYEQALRELSSSYPNAEFRKEFSAASRSIYEYRGDLICGQVKVSYEAKRDGLVSTQKYLNFRIPITFVRVHILSKLQPHSPIQPTRSSVVARSGWTPVSAERLEIIQLDELAKKSPVAGSEIMQRSDESREMTNTGCPQAQMISRDGYADHCVHLGDHVSRLLKDQAASPALTYAIKCAGLYPNRSIHLAWRHRDYSYGGKFERRSDIVANFCINGRWSEDFPLDEKSGSAILGQCRSQDYTRPLEFSQFFKQVANSLQTYNAAVQHPPLGN